jgi:hypothetical protein
VSMTNNRTTALTAARLRELISYEPETGNWTWLVKRNNRTPATSPAGCLHKSSGYLIIKVDNVAYQAHQLAHLYMTGSWAETEMLDHKDTDRSNCKWENIRPATRSENLANSKRRADNTSGYKGVEQHGLRWKARIRVHGVLRHIGYFDSPEEASAAYAKEAIIAFGKFARAS